MPITSLPTKPNNAVRNDPKILVVYGPPKIGKTSILSIIPNNLVVDLEEGAQHLVALSQEVKSLDELKQLFTLIINGGKPYRFITIDTVDVLEQWAEEQGTKDYKKAPMGKTFTGKSVLELPMGAGYFWMRQAFVELLDKIKILAHNIILVGHIRDKLLDIAGKEVAAKDLDLTGKIKAIVCAKADAIGYLGRTKDSKLFITFATKDEIICGSRCQHLKGQTFEMDADPLKFDWSKIYPDEFGRLAKLNEEAFPVEDKNSNSSSVITTTSIVNNS